MSERAAALHASPWLGVLNVTGGGSGLLSEILSTPGASATVLEARVPYASEALTDLLKRIPEQAASESTARAMAVVAFTRAHTLCPDLDPHQLFGFGCTASLSTNREKRGQTRAHWAIHTRGGTFSYHVSLPKALSRTEQEGLLIDAIWQTLLTDLVATETSSDHPVERKHAASSELVNPLFAPVPYRCSIGDPHEQLLLPGSFNPLHEGHRSLLDTAEELVGVPGAYEISVINADKPPLDYLTISERLEQFDETVWLTNTPNFVDKAKLFPHATFALGIDTLIRIADPRFYPEQFGGLTAALDAFAQLDTRFLVFGRLQQGKFLGLEDVELPHLLRGMCQAVPESVFRLDLSSTELRRTN